MLTLAIVTGILSALWTFNIIVANIASARNVFEGGYSLLIVWAIPAIFLLAKLIG